MFQVTTSSHPSSDLSRPSLILTNPANGRKYLFGNIPEGCQRIIGANKQGLNKIDEIFFTGVIDWDAIAGLPGLILTSADQSRTSLKLHYCGPDKIFKYIISTWRYFVFRFGLNLELNELDNGDVINLSKTSGFKVVPISIAPENVSITLSKKEDLNIYNLLSKIVGRVFPTKEQPMRKDLLTMISLPEIPVRSVHSCNYLIEFDEIRGKFLIEKLKLLGVPRGPSYAKLTRGELVTLDDGTVITADQVLEPKREFGKVAILDIPSIEYWKPTLAHSWGKEVGVMYHFLGEKFPISALESQEYLDFLKQYPDTKHIFSHNELCSDGINFKQCALITLKLKSINDELFRLPHSRKASNQIKDNICVLNTLQNITIKPQGFLSIDDGPNVAPDQYWSNLYDENIVPLNLDFYPKEKILLPPKPDSSIDDVEIISLGTGSAIPSNHRNVISTVIRVPNADNTKFQSILLDAGENSIGAIRRTFSKEEYERFFADELSLIFLSHLHADHHLGIISMINEFNLRNSTGRKLTIVCPWQYHHFLNEWFKFNGNITGLQNIQYLNCEVFENNPRKLIPWKQADFESSVNSIEFLEKQFASRDFVIPQNLDLILGSCGIKLISTCKLIHCEWAYSVLITFNGGFKVSYSGDTRPSLEFVKIGQESDLLIHESTLEDELIEDLIQKKHTTILELKRVLLLMKLRRLMLTHFSQRYPRLPNVHPDEEQQLQVIANCLKIDKFSIFKQDLPHHLDDKNIIYAFDYMWFKLNDIHLQYEKFSQLDMSILEKLLVDEEEEEEEEEAEQNNGKKRNSAELS